MEAAFGLGCDQRPVKRGKATQQDHLAKISSISTRRDPHRIAAISMLPDDDDGITCDSCDKDIKYVSGWRGRGEGRGCWYTIQQATLFSFFSPTSRCGFLITVAAWGARVCVSAYLILYCEGGMQQSPTKSTHPLLQEESFRSCPNKLFLSRGGVGGGSCSPSALGSHSRERGQRLHLLHTPKKIT